MSFTTKDHGIGKDADVETLVDTLTMDEAALSTTNLSDLSSTDLQQLAELSDNLAMSESDIGQEQTVIMEEPIHMEVEGEEEIQEVFQEEIQEEIQEEFEEEVHEEIHEEVIEGEDEMEIETDVIHTENIIETKPKGVPPLRPLTIAPKPAQLKPLIGAQQLLFVQNSADGGQHIKFISTAGQNINLSNLNFGKQIALKAAAPKQKTISGKKLLASLPKAMKGHFEGKPQIMLVQKNDQVKLLQATNINANAIAPKTKTLTIAQAQQMGFLVTKGNKQILMNKGAGKTVKLIPQVKGRGPAKILPAPSSSGKMAQRIYIKTSQPSATVMPSQLLQVAGNQVMSSGVHQLMQGKGGVQYIKFVTQQEAGDAPLNAIAMTKSGNKLIPISVSNAMKGGNIVLSELKGLPKQHTVSLSSLHSAQSAATFTTAKLTPISRTLTSSSSTTTSKATSSTPLTLTKLMHTTHTSTSNTPTLLSSMPGIVVLPPGYTTTTTTTATSVGAGSAAVTTAAGGKVAIPAMRLGSGIGVGGQQQVKQLQVMGPTSAESKVDGKVVTMTTASSSGPASMGGGSEGGGAVIEEILKMENNGMRPRKPCNCTKSQCLKLYCDCFANGEFCYMCNCMNCNNNIAHEDFRQRAIRGCLERNPNAFRPKIGKAKDGTMAVTGAGPELVPLRKHTKGCNCKRSGCLKNYCECYEAKIGCSSNCKCIGCRNMETDKRSNRSSFSYSGDTSPIPQVQAPSKISDTPENMSLRPKRVNLTKQPFNFITTEVIEATTQCLLAISDNAETLGQNDETTKVHIIQEFGRCLKQIIECAQTTKSIRGN